MILFFFNKLSIHDDFFSFSLPSAFDLLPTLPISTLWLSLYSALTIPTHFSSLSCWECGYDGRSRQFTPVVSQCRFVTAGLLLLVASLVRRDGRPRSGHSRLAHHDATKSSVDDDDGHLEPIRSQSLLYPHSLPHSVTIGIGRRFQSRPVAATFRSPGRVARVFVFAQRFHSRVAAQRRRRSLRLVVESHGPALQFVPAPPSGRSDLPSAAVAHQRAAVFLLPVLAFPVARSVARPSRGGPVGRSAACR